MKGGVNIACQIGQYGVRLPVLNHRLKKGVFMWLATTELH
jgi:hypothetical protein